MRNPKALLPLFFLITITANAFAQRYYTYEQIETRLDTHPEVVKKDVYRYLYIAKRQQNPIKIGKGYLLLAQLKFREQNVLEAAKAYKKSIDIFRSNGNEGLEARSNQGIGAVYCAMDHFERAEMYQRKNLVYQLKKGTPTQKADAYFSIAYTKAMSGDSDSAMIYYNFAVRIYEDTKDYSGLGRAYGLSLLMFNKAGDYEMALAYGYKTLAMAIRCKDQRLIQGSYAGIGGIYGNLNQLDSAKRYYLLTLELEEKLSAPDLEGYICSRLSEIYTEEDSLEKAHAYLQRAQTIKDTLLTPKKINSINDIPFEPTEPQETHDYWYALPVLSLLILTGTVIYIRRFRKIRPVPLEQEPAESGNDQFLEDEVSRQKKELIAKTMQLQQQNELIERTKTELNNLRLGDNERQQVYEILSDLKSSQSTSNWSEFEHYFNEVHVDFYKKLAIEHPQLTLNDRRLCGLICLNLSNKEISEITRKSVRSIEVAKYRLRVKLSIDKDQPISSELAKYL